MHNAHHWCAYYMVLDVVIPNAEQTSLRIMLASSAWQRGNVESDSNSSRGTNSNNSKRNSSQSHTNNSGKNSNSNNRNNNPATTTTTTNQQQQQPKISRFRLVHTWYETQHEDKAFDRRGRPVFQKGPLRHTSPKNE